MDRISVNRRPTSVFRAATRCATYCWRARGTPDTAASDCSCTEGEEPFGGTTPAASRPAL